MMNAKSHAPAELTCGFPHVGSIEEREWWSCSVGNLPSKTRKCAEQSFSCNDEHSRVSCYHPAVLAESQTGAAHNELAHVSLLGWFDPCRCYGCPTFPVATAHPVNAMSSTQMSNGLPLSLV
jgi:hypothetical protein